METFQLYFLQASMGIVLFYLLYLLLLKNETYYTTNRFFLIVGLILALLLPLFPITYESPIALMQNAEFFALAENSPLAEIGNAGNIQEQVGSGIHFTQLILWFYLVGMTFFFVRLLWQTVRISWRIRHSSFELIDGIKVINQKTTMPYSFFNVVFIDIQEYSERELSNIIAHEKVHIQERHWVDLLIIELMTVLFWVNPVVWLYEKSIKQNHEYLADQGVLLAGYSPGQYQALLINQLMGIKVLGFAHNLNFSLNKKRMKMMKKERSPRASKMKLLLALPIIALLVFAFAKKEYVYETEQNDGLASYERYGEIKVVKEPIRITGEVMTIEGEVIQGAQFNNNQHLFKYQSDANGQFEFEIPKGFKYRETIIDDGNHYKKGLKVLVKKEGYEPSKMLIDPGKTRGKSEVKMRAHINVTGNIIDKHNQPIEGATVMDKKTRIATTSDSKGEFEIASTQYHLLEVKKEGYRTVRYALIDYENNSCNVVMKKGDDPMIKIRGKVLNSEGIPLTGANIILKGTNTGTVVDEQGAFELEAQNTFSLVVSYIGYKTFQNQYDASDQNLTDINIKMEKGTFNIELPDVNDPNFKMQLPPPPPPKNYDDWDGDIYVVIEQMPYYTNGGMSRLALDLKKEIEWVLDKTNNRGEAVVGFTVPANGKIANPYIAKSANSKMLDASAVKIIAKLDNWSAGIQRDKRVSVDMTVPVRFE